MSTAVLFMGARKWKQPKCPLMDEWIDRVCYMHRMKYYSSLKRKAILTHAITWIKHEDIMQSEISQS